MLQSFHGLLPAGMSAVVIARTESNPSKPLFPRSSYHGSSAACGVYARLQLLQNEVDELPYLFLSDIPIRRTYIGAPIVHAKRNNSGLVRLLEIDEGKDSLPWLKRVVPSHRPPLVCDSPRCGSQLYSSASEHQSALAVARKVLCLIPPVGSDRRRKQLTQPPSCLKGQSLAILRL